MAAGKIEIAERAAREAIDLAKERNLEPVVRRLEQILRGRADRPGG